MIARYDGYVLRQLIVMWSFFTLVLAGVFWISRSISLFSTLLGGGHSPWVFFELTALTLPTLLRTVMPMAIFAAVVYVTNRLRRESELVVMQATGASPFRLARPVLLFAVLAAAMIGTITTVLRPASLQAFEEREAELEQDLAAKLLKEGTFLHPMDGVVVYFGTIEPNGTLRDVYISDRRAPARPLTYTAAEAYMVQKDDAIYVVMVDGMVARFDAASEELSATWFDDLTVDISRYGNLETQDQDSLRALPTSTLMSARAELIAEGRYSEGQLVEELHERLSWIGICIAVAMIGFTALMTGAHSRFGLWTQIGLAFVLLIGVEAARGGASGLVLNNPQMWWIYHLPTVLGCLVAGGFLSLAGRPLRLFRPKTG
ncbi:LPS export ABC transporter permease LptF [Phaeobacter sp. B1627]|uniref:LPS export ABC transporter permease LptF n=1 Tax=Phaeobacter sp. B1627 TaxID=2583809 RepID=UPI0021029FFE|nr:LPS export ABC transporter permease LptF [Phaeobacter sp. B1627]